MSSEPARSPRETSHYLSTQMLAKAHNPWGKSFLLAVAAGVMIGLGYVFYITTQQGAANADWLGEVKLLGGVAFSVGLILVVMTGADLFTSTTMTVVRREPRGSAHARRRDRCCRDVSAGRGRVGCNRDHDGDGEGLAHAAAGVSPRRFL